MIVGTSATCYSSCAESGIFIGTSAMTVELCLQACTSYGYTYASINMFEFRIIVFLKKFLTCLRDIVEIILSWSLRSSKDLLGAKFSAS